jgi:hypothetical protein
MTPNDSILSCKLSFTNVGSCDTFRRMAKLKGSEEPAGSWIAPAVQRKSVKQLLIDLPREHIEELEKKGLLPKGK